MSDPRKAIFDAIRAAKSKPLRGEEVIVIDDALDSINVPRAVPDEPAEPAGHRLGSVSERFESGGQGPGAVSSGVGDPGGVSYGIWQLSSTAGTAAAFVSSEGAPWRSELSALPGSASFSAAWKAIAAREPGRFADAQHAFIQRTHYAPAVKGVLAATGLDLDSRHDAVRDATWSVSVQHGGAVKILTTAVREADKAPGRASADYDRALVNEIYDARTAYVLDVGARSGSTTTLKTMQSIARNRYPEERQAALAMFA